MYFSPRNGLGFDYQVFDLPTNRILVLIIFCILLEEYRVWQVRIWLSFRFSPKTRDKSISHIKQTRLYDRLKFGFIRSRIPSYLFTFHRSCDFSEFECHCYRYLEKVYWLIQTHHGHGWFVKSADASKDMPKI